jgi:hypothetical protein
MATIVENGIAYLALCVTDGTTTVPSYVGVGTGTTDEAATQTALVTEVDTRGLTNNTRETVTITNDTAVYTGQVVASTTRSITEAALFSASSSGTMIMRGKFGAVSLAADEIIEVICKIQFA